MDQLPPELIEQILSHLPTASAITNLSQTCQKLHDVIKKGENSIWHTFAQRQFPSIGADPPWRETAFNLASRARAFDRRAFIARECAPPRDDGSTLVQVHRGHHFGFMPVIDSYNTSAAESGREVLAWGAAGRLRLRTTKGKDVKWSSYSIPDDANPHTDILDLHLLRPRQNRNRFGESILIRRANREIALLNAMPEKDNWVPASKYVVKADTTLDCVDVNQAVDPLLAVCDSKAVQLFPVHTSKETMQADKIVPVEVVSTTKQRKRCAKFMSEDRLAVATQHLEGLQQAPIEIFDISPSGLESVPIAALQIFSAYTAATKAPTGRIGANCLANVTDNPDRGSPLLLSGWSDGLVRLYDLRSGNNPVRAFADAVDDGQIFSLLTIGQERFLAGSHQNACLKVFDMRMDGQVYNYRQTRPIEPPTSSKNGAVSTPSGQSSSRSARGLNIFLALTVHRATQPWQPLPGRQNNARLPRYRGSIYSLSSPSPSSRTVYAGIENHVIQLDFTNTDDWLVNRGKVRNHLDDRPVLNLSCYERPRRGHESTDIVLLRKQRDLEISALKDQDIEPGWDERWKLEQQRTRKGMAASWWQSRS